MAPAPLSTGFQSFPPLPTIKLGPSGAGSRVGGIVHALGPCGSLQVPLLWGWESLLLLPQPLWVFSIRGLRLYFPALEPWVMRTASLPSVHPGLSVRECGASVCYPCSACPVLHHSESGPLGLSVQECGAAGSASGQTACPVGPTLRQSRSATATPVLSAPAAGLRPSYRSGWMFIFYLLGFRHPCRSIFRQFWLWEEVQCVHLCRHLGSLRHPCFDGFSFHRKHLPFIIK